jgi:hypothetical protein
MPRALFIVLFALLFSCVTTASLEDSAMEHEANARQLAQLGDGEEAARQAHLAASEREEARRRSERHHGYWHSEVLME